MFPQITFNNFLAAHEGHATHGATVKELGFFKARRARRQAQAESYYMYESDVALGAWDGSFLEWLFAHADEIFALIAKIIALFSV